MITHVIKRDGRQVPFDRSRIVRAVGGALKEVGMYSTTLVDDIVDEVVETLENLYPSGTPQVEQVQDVIELTFMRRGLFDVAKAFILYRERKRQIREEKKKLLKKDTLSPAEKRFSLNAVRLLTIRYLWKDPSDPDRFLEDVDGLFTRVAVLGAIPEILYDGAIFDKDGGHKYTDKMKAEVEEYRKKWQEEPEQFDNLYKIDEGFPLNKYHFERFLYLYDLLAQDGHMKYPLSKVLSMLESGKYFDKAKQKVREFFKGMTHQQFMPNTPALVNAGRPLGMLSACFTVSTDDSLDAIMDTAKEMAIIAQMGGGVGINLSVLRPKGDIVKRTVGVASGPISFLELYDRVLSVISQGGVRRGAGMAILEYWHPQVMDFIKAKEKNRGDNYLSTFNLSVGSDEHFWEAVYSDEEIDLINPRNKAVLQKMRAREILDKVAEYAWAKGDPAFLYFHNGNRYNIRKNKLGEIRVTNPCGEEFLYPYESCNLASVNVEAFVRYDEEEKPYFDWEAYAKTIRTTARLLDNFVDVNNFPLDKIRDHTRAGRNIGVGIMGVANALFRLGIPYTSEEGYKFMERLAEYLTYYSMEESLELAKERGPFSYWEETDYKEGKLPVAGVYTGEPTLPWDKLAEEIKQYGIRNVDHTTAPPTGSVSMISDTSSGIEPLFSLVFKKVTTVGTYYYTNKVFEEVLRKRGMFDEVLLEKISSAGGSLKDLEDIPEDLKEVFITAMDIHWADHVIAQTTFQKWITNSISKTINMANSVSVADVKKAFVLAERLGAKGVTVYRDGSLDMQVYVAETQKEYHEPYPASPYARKVIDRLVHRYPYLRDFFDEEDISGMAPMPMLEIEMTEKLVPVKEDSGEVTVCPVCGNEKLSHESGCITCPVCGWSMCTSS
ncbi:adenosylcobalamin-dependent ribonucleoside-diphosphate reductase [bacterium 3DAC]|nr:adenosylcobalamin-dependent ribonucleoside-diphosphate reductase [bacterium 3DAC]